MSSFAALFELIPDAGRKRPRRRDFFFGPDRPLVEPLGTGQAHVRSHFAGEIDFRRVVVQRAHLQRRSCRDSLKNWNQRRKSTKISISQKLKKKTDLANFDIRRRSWNFETLFPPTWPGQPDESFANAGARVAAANAAVVDFGSVHGAVAADSAALAFVAVACAVLKTQLFIVWVSWSTLAQLVPSATTVLTTLVSYMSPVLWHCSLHER